MKTLYLECNMGAAGDMLMAALYELMSESEKQDFLETMNRLFPGVREMLQTLREYADLCIVSNGEHDYIALCLQVFGLTDVFVRTATSVPGRTKGENLRALLDDLRPERAVMVGDRLGDIRAGQENGLPTIAACYGYGNDAEYNQASLRAESVADLTRQLVDFCRTGHC